MGSISANGGNLCPVHRLAHHCNRTQVLRSACQPCGTAGLPAFAFPSRPTGDGTKGKPRRGGVSRSAPRTGGTLQQIEKSVPSNGSISANGGNLCPVHRLAHHCNRTQVVRSVCQLDGTAVLPACGLPFVRPRPAGDGTKGKPRRGGASRSAPRTGEYLLRLGTHMRFFRVYPRARGGTSQPGIKRRWSIPAFAGNALGARCRFRVSRSIRAYGGTRQLSRNP